MKSLCLLLSLPLLLVAQYGMDGSPSYSQSAPVAASPAQVYGSPLVQEEARHDVLWSSRRGHRYRGRKDRSSSSSQQNEPCRKLRSSCKDVEGDAKLHCEKADIEKSCITCRGKRGELVQMHDGHGKLIDYGLGSVVVDKKCKNERWRVDSFNGDRVKVRNVVCYRFPLPAIINIDQLDTPRTHPFNITTFFDSRRVSDALNWSASVFVVNPKAADNKEVREALDALDAAVTPNEGILQDETANNEEEALPIDEAIANE